MDKDLKKDIIEYLIKKDNTNILFYVLFNYHSYRERNGSYFFYFRNEAITDFILDYIEKHTPKEKVSKALREEKSYLFFESKPLYQHEYDFDGVLVLDERDYKIVFLFIYLIAGKVNDFNNPLIEIKCNYHNYAQTIRMIQIYSGYLLKYIEKNNSFYVYSKNDEVIYKMFSKISRFKTIEDDRENFLEKHDFGLLKKISSIEVSNILKTSEIAYRILNRVNELKETNRYEKLDEETKMLFDMKIKNPDFSFSKLAEEMSKELNKDLTKDRIAYILKKHKV